MQGDIITYDYFGSLYINMTNRCDCHCVFCIRDEDSSALGGLWLQEEPSREAVLEDILSKDLSQYSEIVFCGYGEPACRWDDMMWLCDRIRGQGSHFIRINTNGLANLITGRNAALELDGRVDAVSISLNASTPEGYDAICHSRFGLEALPAILRFTSTAVLNVPHVRMTVVSTMPKAEQEACRQLAESVGADFFVREYISQ